MNNSKKLSIFSVAVALCTFSDQKPARAASGIVGVSINFTVAPADLFRIPDIAPRDVRSCESMNSSIGNAWAGRTKRPNLNCSSQSDMPLVVTSANAATLVVRP